MFLDPDQEIGLLAAGTGLRVSLHQPNVKPFPEEDGFSVAPGRATSVGVRQVSIAHGHWSLLLRCFFLP